MSRAQEHVEAMLGGFSIQIATVDAALAKRAAAVRARTSLKLPDAYALATAIQLERCGHTGVRLATFDKKVLKAHQELHPPQLLMARTTDGGQPSSRWGCSGRPSRGSPSGCVSDGPSSG